MIVIIVILIIAAALAIYFIQGKSYEKSINSQVESLGGQVISIERTIVDNGPFFIRGKGNSIYRFEYTIDDERKEGWVRFVSLLGPDWKM